MKGGNYIAYWALRQLYATGGRPKLPVTFMLIPDAEAGSPTSREEIEAEAQQHRPTLVAEPARHAGALTTARFAIASAPLTHATLPVHPRARNTDRPPTPP